MNNNADQSHDFMAVDSFSQLPFIRPNNNNSSSSSSNPSSPSSAIRLFGIDVPHDPTKHSSAASAAATATSSSTGDSSSSSRKFECHYCCRNFPTSQALGGHQNAHKRERQHAKRAHLQSTFAAHHHQLYNMHNYHRYGSLPPPTASNHCSSFGTAAPPQLGLGSLTKPINGSPLAGLWQVPSAVHCEPMASLPLFRGDGFRAHGVGGGGSGSGLDGNFGGYSSSPPSNSPKRRVICEQENVSLDLHL